MKYSSNSTYSSNIADSHDLDMLEAAIQYIVV